MSPVLNLHHIGYAVRDWQKELTHLSALGYTAETPPFQDPQLGIEGIFAIMNNGVRIELVQNLPGRTTLDPFLRNGIKCYHFAYEVKNLEQTTQYFLRQGAKLTLGPTPAVAFANRRIAFVMLRNLQLVEFIEIQEK